MRRSGTHTPWSSPWPGRTLAAAQLDKAGVDVFSQSGQSRRGILELVQRLGKAAEIMHGMRLRIPAQHRVVGHEMCRGDHDRARPRQGIAEPIEEAARRGLFDRQHRRAVGQEQGGKASRSVHPRNMLPTRVDSKSRCARRSVPETHAADRAEEAVDRPHLVTGKIAASLRQGIRTMAPHRHPLHGPSESRPADGGHRRLRCRLQD